MPKDNGPEVSRSELVAQLRSLGVEEGGVLLVRTGFSAVRPVEESGVGRVHELDGQVLFLSAEHALRDEACSDLVHGP